MGLGPRWGNDDWRDSTVEYRDRIVVKNVPNGNPNPANFKIVREKAIGNNLVAEVIYPDANNYEGRKILVYKSKITLRDEKYLDPHFCEDKSALSPFARFEPTEEGWDSALKCCCLLNYYDTGAVK